MKSYLITDSSFYQFGFEKVLRYIYQTNQIDYSCFRDKTTKDFTEFFDIFLKLSREFGIKNILINSHIELAIKYNIGIHLTSSQLNQIDYCKSKGLFVVVSTHNVDELSLAKDADAVTISPIFESPNKGKPIGIDGLNKLAQNRTQKIFALGGIIDKNQIEELQKNSTQCYGFASIRYFVKDFL